MNKIIALNFSLFAAISCCLWQGFAYGLSDFLTNKEIVTAEEYLTEMYGVESMPPPEIIDFQGVRVGIFSQTYYLRYTAEKEFVLSLIDAMPYNVTENVMGDYSPSIDCTFYGKYEYVTNETLRFFQTLDELKDVRFWRPEQINYGEYYVCRKEPWTHTILFDKKSQTVYEVIIKILE